MFMAFSDLIRNLDWVWKKIIDDMQGGKNSCKQNTFGTYKSQFNISVKLLEPFCFFFFFLIGKIKVYK